MKIYIICIFITTIPNIELHLLPIKNKKICANCKFFISDKKECSKFGNVDIITGDHDYENAIDVRNNEDKCGEDGIFFKNNYLKIIFIPFEFLLKNSKLFELFFSLCYQALPFFILLILLDILIY